MTFHWWERPRVVMILNIEDEQLERVRAATREDVRKSAELRKKLREEREVLSRLLGAEELDEAAIARQSEKVLATFASVLKVEADIQLKAVKELTADQRRELMELRNSAAERVREAVRDGGKRRPGERSGTE
jgi:Spy/CpxP family protein refolding chaperone